VVINRAFYFGFNSGMAAAKKGVSYGWHLTSRWQAMNATTCFTTQVSSKPYFDSASAGWRWLSFYRKESSMFETLRHKPYADLRLERLYQSLKRTVRLSIVNCLFLGLFAFGMAYEARTFSVAIDTSDEFRVPLFVPRALPVTITINPVLTAAQRNHCTGELFVLLQAIQRSEHGPTNREFGVMDHRAVGLDAQAGWAAATIVKNHQRWIAAGRPGDFVVYLGQRYCPPSADPLNRNWVRNVSFWYHRLGGTSIS
jgi:hypothetical protein